MVVKLSKHVKIQRNYGIVLKRHLILTNKQTGINQTFDENRSIVSDKKEIANIFDQFFVYVGIGISDIKKYKYKMCDLKELNKNCYINNSIFFRSIN